MPRIIPMRLLRIPEAFDHPDFLFEPKFDGFRALAHVETHRCTLVSRNGNTFKSWPQLGEEIAHIVCLDEAGKPEFRSLPTAERRRYCEARSSAGRDGDTF